MNEKLKIGIMTYYTNSINYGGCLQAYALCEIINDLDYDAKQIVFGEDPTVNTTLFIKLKDAINEKRLFSTIKIKCHSDYNKIIAAFSRESENISTFINSFTDFRNNVIRNTQKRYTPNSLKECTEFDMYITGSDQVWNVSKNATELHPGYWLTCVPDGKKKISYAASISRKELPAHLHDNIRDALSSFSAISVREKHDKELLDDILHGTKQIDWVLDPTLLIQPQKWKDLCAENPYRNEEYVFAYLLGDKKQDRKFIMDFAAEKGLKVITIPYLLRQYRSCDKKIGDIRLFDVTPQMWISLIRDAKYVITDSFHGTVFASIFRTPFYIFKRCKDNDTSSMNSRIYSLMDLYHSRERIIENTWQVEFVDQLRAIDFDYIDHVLDGERKKSMDFLIHAIES